MQLPVSGRFEIMLERGSAHWMARYNGPTGEPGVMGTSRMATRWPVEVPAEIVRRQVEADNAGAFVRAVHAEDVDCYETIDAATRTCLLCGAQQWRQCRLCKARSWHTPDCAFRIHAGGRPLAVMPCTRGVC